MELYRNEQGTFTTNIPIGSTNVDITLVQAGAFGGNISSFNYDSVTGAVTISIPFSLTGIDQEFDIYINFSLGSELVAISERIAIVTGLLSRADAEAISPGRYEDTEPIVRHIIETITGRSFGKWQGSFVVGGQAYSAIELPERLISLDSVYRGDTAEDNAMYYLKGDGWYLAKQRFSVDAASSIEFNTPDGEPIAYPFRSSGKFVADALYTISGTWGYENVPFKIQQAAKLLFADYVCNESTYRNKYIESISTQGWKANFNEQAFTGTGNVLVDQLISDYVKHGMFTI